MRTHKNQDRMRSPNPVCRSFAAIWDGATTLAGLAQKWNGHGREKNQIKAAQMFCEIELGQRLGPNPGGGGDHTRR